MTCASALRTYVCTVEVDATMAEGTQGFEVVAADAAGNLVGPIIPPVTVELDYTPPVLSIQLDPERVTEGDLLTAVVDASEPLDDLPHVDGLACAATAERRILCTGLVGSQPRGPLSVRATGRDRAGNTSTAVDAVADYYVAPTIALGEVAPAFAREGVAVAIGFSADQLIDECRASLGGRDASCSLPLGSVCSCTAVVGPEVADGTVEVVGVGIIGRLSGTASTQIEVDRRPPALDVTADRPRATAGEPIAFFVDADEPLGEPPAIRSSLFGADVPCAGPAPGRHFRCDAVVAPSVQAGVAVYLATGADRAGNAGESSQGTIPVVVPPAVHVADVDPAIARDGAQVTLTLSADQPLLSCGSDAGGPAVRCDPPAGSACTCFLVVDASVAEGPLDLPLFAENENGTGRAVATLVVDRTPPTVDPARATIVRYPLGVDDAVAGAAAVAIDGGVGYPGQAVVELRIWDELAVGSVLLSISPSGDGSFAELPIPGTELRGPRALWASAVDAAGNEGPRVELSGSDREGPSGSPAALSFVRRPWGEVDAVRGGPGAFSDASAIVEVELFDAAVGGAALASAEAASDGSFGPVDVGTPTFAPGRAWASATDKCGNTGERFEVLDGRDVDPPAIDRVRIVLARGRAGLDDTVEGSPGAITDSPPGELGPVRLFDAPAGGRTIGDPFFVDGAGGFPARSAGAPGVGGVWIEATDKSGNVARAAAGAERVVLGLAGRVPYVPDSAPGSVVPFVADVDPRGAPAGLAWTIAPEASASESASIAATDGERLVTIAEPETDLVPHAWVQISPSHPGPRLRHAIAYDTARGVTVLFGGIAGGARNDTWERTDGGWVQVETPVSPPARAGHAMAFDETRGRLVLYGGSDPQSGLLDDTWEYDGSTWTQIVTPTLPGAGFALAMAYDAGRQRVVLGGKAAHAGWRLWEFDGTDWISIPAQHAPSHPGNAKLAFDTSRNVLVLLGRNVDNYVMELEGLTWVLRATPTSLPRDLSLGSLVYDAARGRIVHFGGTTGRGNGDRDDTWEYDGTTWTLATPLARPPARVGHAMAYDAGRGRVVVSDGATGWYDFDRVPPMVWEYDGTTWTSVPETAMAAQPKLARTCAWDVARARLVAIDRGPAGTRTWTHDGSSWTELATTGASPPSDAVYNASLAYDAVRGRIVLFAGMTQPRLTWELDGSAWTQVATATVPSSERDHALSYDPRRRRVVLFGGMAVGPTEFDELWEYDGASWALAVAGGGPPERWSASLAHDAVRGRTIVTGGIERTRRGGVGRFPGAWEWDGTAWTEVPPVPSPGGGLPGFTFDPARARSVFFGGDLERDETWELEAQGWSQVIPLEGPHPRNFPCAVFDTVRRRVIGGGGVGFDNFRDLWALESRIPHARVPAHAISFEFGPRPVLDATVTYVGAGVGDGGAGATAGVELLAFRNQGGTWTSLGSHVAADVAPALERTIRAAIPQPLDEHLIERRLELLAVPLFGSAQPPGLTEAELSTDLVEVEVTYPLP